MFSTAVFVFRFSTTNWPKRPVAPVTAIFILFPLF
jgi:hypothetical protein